MEESLRESNRIYSYLSFNIRFAPFTSVLWRKMLPPPLLQQPPRTQSSPKRCHASRHSRSIAGIRRSPNRSRTWRNTRSIWTNALRWCWTLCSRSRTKWIRRWRFGAPVARAFAARARWTLAAAIRWPAFVASTTIWASRAKSIRCRICTWCVIWCRTWPTSTISTRPFSRGCSASRFFT